MGANRRRNGCIGGRKRATCMTLPLLQINVGFVCTEDLDAALPFDTFTRLSLPWEAG